MNVSDPRFLALYSSSEYAIDPTNPAFMSVAFNPLYIIEIIANEAQFIISICFVLFFSFSLFPFCVFGDRDPKVLIYNGKHTTPLAYMTRTNSMGSGEREAKRMRGVGEIMFNLSLNSY